MNYKFRAECQSDIERFLTLTVLIGMRSSIKRITTHQSGGLPDVDCELETTDDLTLAKLVAALALLEDGHVMAQTINTAEKYNGKRIRKT